MKKINDTKNIQFERIWAMPNKNTFDILPIKKLISEEVNLKDFWIDPFANKNKIATVTNWANHKKEISRIVKLGGKVITFGWNSGGIGYKYGFEIKRILLVPHGG